MSLFASLGQGDIWALSGISFASPINDLLEKGDFTLEQLLEEDELIQEVKSKNERLVQFLSTDEAVDQLLDYIIKPAVPAESSVLVYKFPYMSCEVICCEIPELLQRLVIDSDGKHLRKLFSFLTVSGKLDYYLAGYFEKILEMLFRRMTVPMMKYFNDSGSALLSQFLNHMDNYSIMQIVQRLMLPHIPFSNLGGEGDAAVTDEEREQQQCSWSYQSESCAMLFNRMFQDADAEVPLHISDLLITVLQLSPPETFVIQYLCKGDCIRQLLNGALADGSDMVEPGDDFTPIGSISLAAISVLESLSSRLFESSLPFDSNQSCDAEDAIDQTQQVKQNIDNICSELVPFIKYINDTLLGYIRTKPCNSFTNQSKSSACRLGHRGLQLVKLIESVVRLGNVDVDAMLCSTGIFRTCLKLLFEFVNNSLLHLSIQRIILTIIEGDTTKSKMQQHLLVECSLIDTVMKKMRYYHHQNDDEEDVQIPLTMEEERAPIKASHSSIAGNLVIISQAISFALDPEVEKEPESEAISNGLEVADHNRDAENPVDSINRLDEIGNNANVLDPKGDFAETSSEKPNNLRMLISDENLLLEWDSFVESLLKPVLNHQIVGSYQSPTSISALSSSQDDPLKLGIDIDMFHLESGSGSMDEDDDEDIIVGPNPSIAWERNKSDPFDDAVPTTVVEDEADDPFRFPSGGENSNSGFADFASFGNSVASGASFQSSFHGDDNSQFADFADFDSASIPSEVTSHMGNMSLGASDSQSPLD